MKQSYAKAIYHYHFQLQVVSLWRYPRVPHYFGGKFKCCLLLQKADTARCFPGFGKNGKPSKRFVAFTLINCNIYTKSISKHYRLHATATSLGLPEPLFCKKFYFWDNKRSYTLASNNKILLTCPNALTEMFLNILTCFPSIWKHIKALPLHKITFIAAKP